MDISPTNVVSQVIQREILKTILYQNVAYNCTKLLFFTTAIEQLNTLPQEIKDISLFKTFSQKNIISCS